MSEVVLDASALLAFLNEEPGSEVVASYLDRAAMSAVNLSEVVAKLTERDTPEALIQEFVEQLQVSIVAVDQSQAVAAGLLRPQTRAFGLSLGDRACLALGLHLNQPVITTDRQWQNLDLALEIQVIR
jgi:PIN domain nuclease of toxin-antitoxin system